MNSVFSLVQIQTSDACGGVRTYLDDILVHASDFPSFIEILHQALTCLENAGFKVSLEKCKFGLTEIKFLGFVLLSQNGKRPDPSKVEAILCLPQLKSTKEVFSWLQTANFYRRFVPAFSNVAAPLHRLARSSTYVWTPECHQAFMTLRTALTTAPILAHFDPAAPTTVTTDAAAVALGAILSPKRKSAKTEKMLLLNSQAVSDTEKKPDSNI
ncbi:uncharacterized protein LOC135387736 [Ornithodoros turicata]|uniref:uncharacterized protein LOC135387736 n=1 Tax=Ornithodoros turicata TaxID=34597 RepID=UPI0031396E00